MSEYRAAIIGLTGIGAGAPPAVPDPVLGRIMPHSHAAAYAASPRTTVVAVCDLVPDLLEGFRRRWADAFPDVRTYTDYREMLAKESVDLLSVVTPDDKHAAMVVDGAEAGVRGILCEKPIATTLADADRMAAACERRGVPLLIEHTRRWQPQYLEARRLVRSGAIGRLSRIVATLGGPRAMLFRNGTHLVDTVCLFAEADPAWVVGELDDEQAGYGPRYAGDGGHDPGTDPGASAYVHFANGVRAFINASKGTMRNFEVDLVGESGRIRLGNQPGEMWRQSADGGLCPSALQPPQTTRADLLAAVEELIGLVEHGGEGSSTAADGRRALSIILGILQSSHAGGRRVDFPITDA